MCGMCSQYCPTYGLTLDENESPRGRIALINALQKGQLAVNDTLVTHLEHCTYCRACENYCPSGVRFGAIMDSAKSIIAKQQPQPRYEQRVQNILATPEKTRRLGRWLGRYQRWGLQRLMRASGLLSLTRFSQGDKLLPSISDIPAQLEYSPALENHRGDVALFTGCVTSIMDRQALDASRRLLNRLGYGVFTPAGQTCCGALHQHSGKSEQAIELVANNIAVFNALDVDAIVHTSTGCTSFLKEYDQLTELDKEQDNPVKAFTGKVQDINHFVVNVDWPEDITIKALPGRVVVHEPCSARNVLRQANDVYRLLERIPGIEVEPLANNGLCCGASGSQLLGKSEFAERLRQKKLQALDEVTNDGKQPVNTLVTSNISCALHLASGIREQGIPVEVMHPITLLMKQIDAAQTCTSTPASAMVDL